MEMVGERTVAAPGRKSFAVPLALMVALYFGIGFITALNDILVPHFKDIFRLSNTASLLVQFCFFGAYFVMSVPSGWIVGKIGYKGGIVASLSVVTAGLLLFQPAARIIFYPLFLFALFVVGSGLALLQVAINPYIGALGSPETASSRLNLGGGFNSIAGTLAPKVGAMFIFIAAGASTAQLARSVRMPYLVLAGCAFAMVLVTAFVPLPELIEKRSTERADDGGAWRFRHLRLGALAIFFYVGAEVAIGSIMISYLGQPSMGSLSHAAAALLLMAITILTHGPVALWATVLCGLCNSVMWPCIFPLALTGLGTATSQGSGILVTMVVGGAIIPLLQGFLADSFGFQRSFLLVLACYAYLLHFALKGHRPVYDPVPAEA